MSSAKSPQSLPSWALPLIIVVGVAGLAIFGWKTFTGGSDYVGPPKEVHAGMFSLRDEVAKMRAAKSPNKGASEK
ncbi:MAG: hypothetical protein NT023_16635 [Armatimonadetes bacterium]|nr:hypothetical protein [Armatimonadota bacterium]